VVGQPAKGKQSNKHQHCFCNSLAGFNLQENNAYLVLMAINNSYVVGADFQRSLNALVTEKSKTAEEKRKKKRGGGKKKKKKINLFYNFLRKSFQCGAHSLSLINHMGISSSVGFESTMLDVSGNKDEVLQFRIQHC